MYQHETICHFCPRENYTEAYVFVHDGDKQVQYQY